MVQHLGRSNNGIGMVNDMTLNDLRKEKGEIQPDELMLYVKELMKPEDIDHHASDLYLRKNAISEELVRHFKYSRMVRTFVSNIEPRDLWYEFPFCYWESRV